MGTAAAMRNYGAQINQKTLPRINGIIVSCLGLGLGGFALAAGPLEATSVGVLLFALGLLALCAWSFTYRATIYENGVVVQSIFGQRSIGFAELRSFGYSRARTNGQPRDTLEFIPRNGKPVRIVTQPDFRSGGDADLARLVEALTPKFVERMEKELARAKRVTWVERAMGSIPPRPTVSLTREAYQVEDGKSSATIPYVTTECVVVNGVFVVTELGSGKLLFRTGCGAPNFYPGLTLQQRLREAAIATSVQRPAGE